MINETRGSCEFGTEKYCKSSGRNITRKDREKFGTRGTSVFKVERKGSQNVRDHRSCISRVIYKKLTHLVTCLNIEVLGYLG